MYFLLNWSFFAIFKQTFCFFSGYCTTLERILCWDLTIQRTLKKVFFVFLMIATFFFALVISDKWLSYIYESTCFSPPVANPRKAHHPAPCSPHTGEIWKRTLLRLRLPATLVLHENALKTGGIWNLRLVFLHAETRTFKKRRHQDYFTINPNPKGCTRAFWPPLIVSFSNFSDVR